MTSRTAAGGNPGWNHARTPEYAAGGLTGASQATCLGIRYGASVVPGVPVVNAVAGLLLLQVLALATVAQRYYT